MEYGEVIGVSEGIDDQIKQICVNYLQLVADCAKYDQVRDYFLNNRHEVLNNRVGMKIPQEAAIILDSRELGWPVIYIKTADGDKYVVHEGYLSVQVLEDLPSGAEISETTKTKEQAEVDIMLHESLKGSQVVIKMPFFDVKADMLGEIKFSDDAEIILSTA